MFIFIYGKDNYRSAKKLTEIKDNYILKTDPSGINVLTFDGDDFNLEKFNNAAVQGGFLAEKRLIIVKNILSGKISKQLSEQLAGLLKRLEKSENLFVFWEKKVPDQRTVLFKLLSKNKKFVQSFEPLSGADLSGWLKNYLSEHGSSMENSALALLISYIGDDLWQLTGELDKLSAFKKNQIINSADVKEFVSAKISENIFGLTDAIASGNKKAALKILQQQLNLGVNEIYMLTMVTRQFRILAQIKSLMSHKVDYRNIASRLELNPYVFKKSFPLAQKFTHEKFRKIYQKIVDLDRKLKTSSLPPAVLLDLLVLEI